MYERSYGTKYQEFHTDANGERVYRSAAEIAKAIRADIKAAVKAGELPKARYSVKSDSYTGGSSVDVTIGEAALHHVGHQAPSSLPRSDP